MTSETAFSDHEFSLLARLVAQTSGISLGQQKKEMLRLRIGKRMRMLGTRSFLDYYRKARADSQELTEMLDAVATNVTHFFREEHHFHFLADKLPKLADEHGELRIWSAGCATGEEPYSIAMTARETMGEGGRGRVRIAATDISTKALQRAVQGIYPTDNVSGRLPESTMYRHFQQGSGEQQGKVRVKAAVREMIRFGHLNLLDRDLPFRKPFHAIFCRNVMIYFQQDVRMQLLSRFHSQLIDGGYLFLGHSETVMRREDFVPVDLTVFRKV